MRKSALAKAVRIGALALLCALPWVSQAQTANADRDGDGLIEIDSLQMLHNMRYNLAGTSYKTTSTASVGDSSGCPAQGGCYGYELTQDLDFDLDGDGRTWSSLGSSDGSGGYTLDPDDNQADYFPVENDGTGGWLPIGVFVATFDGNGHSIRNLAIRRDQESIGLFTEIRDDAAIRNVGLIDNLAEYTGSSGSEIGGLVGVQRGGSITASYATGAGASEESEFGNCGGLVGAQHGGSITASYASGAIISRNGFAVGVGGLVGAQHGGSITASYASGAVTNRGGLGDSVGGLVGWKSGGPITASYATGAVTGIGGTLGGLVGVQTGGPITASYATGAVVGRTSISGGLVGRLDFGLITASYSFGRVIGQERERGTDGSVKPQGVSTAAQLTAANAGSSWNDAGSNTLGAWDFGTASQIPALNYADYDGAGTAFSCDQFLADACDTLLPGQEDLGPGLSISSDEVVENLPDGENSIECPVGVCLFEGGSILYGVRLTLKPAVDVVVRVMPGQAGTFTLTAEPEPGTLTFTLGNWQRPQQVMISVSDNDHASREYGENVAALVQFAASRGDYEDVSAEVTIFILEDDRAGLTLSGGLLESSVLREGGSPGEYGLRLSSQPTAPVTVQVEPAPSHFDVRVNSQPGATILTFAPADWDQTQTVMVSVVDDVKARPDGIVTLSLTVSGGGYDGVEIAPLSLRIEDNDERGVALSMSTINVKQGGTAHYEIGLKSQPDGGDLMVALRLGTASNHVISANGRPLSVDSNNTFVLTFSENDTNLTKTIALRVENDEVDRADEVLMIHHDVSGADYGSVTASSIELNIENINTAGFSEVFVGFSTLFESEPDGVGRGGFFIQATSRPAAEVLVDLIIEPSAFNVVADFQFLIFEAGTPQAQEGISGEIILVDDEIDSPDARVQISFEVRSADPRYDVLEIPPISFFMVDDDERGVSITPTDLTVDEGDEVVYTLVLKSRPTMSVTVNFEPEPSEGYEVTFMPESLTFEPDMWNSPQEVTVTSVDNDVDAADGSLRITHRVSGGDYDLLPAAAVPVVELAIRNDDERSLSITPLAVAEIPEGGEVGLRVVLGSEPTAMVTVTPVLEASPGYEVTAAPLVITPGQWMGDNQVRLSLTDDDVDRDDGDLRINFRVTGGGYGEEVPLPINLRLKDDDERGLSISPTSLSVDEGTSVEYGLRLKTEPTAPVVVSLVRQEAGVFDADVSLNTLSFNFGTGRGPGGWDRSQTVTISLARNFVDQEQDSFDMQITHRAEEGDYEGESGVPVTVTLRDIDERGLVIEVPEGQVLEDQGTFIYRVSLASKPSEGEVEVTVTISEPGAVVQVPPTYPDGPLTFAADNWDEPKRVQVSLMDNNEPDDAVTVDIEHSASGADYGSETRTLPLTIDDDDSPPSDVRLFADLPAEQRVLAEGAASQTIVLRARLNNSPFTEPMILILSLSDTVHADTDQARAFPDFTAVLAGEQFVPGSELTLPIPAGQSEVEARLEWRPLDDPFAEDAVETVELRAAVEGLAFAGEPVVLGIRDNDEAGVRFTDADGAELSPEKGLKVAEGEAISYRVALTSVPEFSELEMMLDVAGDDGDLIELSAQSATEYVDGGPVLDFTLLSTVLEPRTVTVAAGIDPDNRRPRQLTIVHTLASSDAVYGALPSPIALPLLLIDPGLVVSTASLSLAEGEEAVYTLALTSEPDRPVTVSLRVSGGGGSLRLEDGGGRLLESLSFDANNWSEPRQVTVILLDDGLYSGPRTATISHELTSGDRHYHKPGVFSDFVSLDLVDRNLPSTEIRLSADLSPEQRVFAEGAAPRTIELRARLNNAPFAVAQTLALSISDPVGEVDDFGENIDIRVVLAGQELVRGSEPDVNVVLDVPAGAQEVTVILELRPEDDRFAEGTEIFEVRVVMEGLVSAGTLTLMIDDDDEAGLVFTDLNGNPVPLAGLRVAEGEATLYRVGLSSQPEFEPVAVTLSVAGEGSELIQLSEGSNDPDDALTLFFIPGSDRLSSDLSPKTVTIWAGEDANRNDVRQLRIVHAIASDSQDAFYRAVQPVEVPLRLTDAGVLISPTSLTLAEKDGGTGSYEVKLTSPPSANVVVSLILSDDDKKAISLDTQELTFTTENWETSQNVRVTAEDDMLSNGRRKVTIGHTTENSLDTDYLGVVLPSVEVTIEDDDSVPGVLLFLTPDSLVEGSSTDNTDLEREVQLTVRAVLDGPLRSAATRLTLFIGGDGDSAVEGTDYRTDVGSGTILVIPALTREVRQPITLTLFQDRIDELDESFTVAITADLDPETPRTSTAVVSFTIEDDDEAGVEVRLRPQNLREGDVLSWEVILTSEPTEDVFVTVRAVSPADSDARVEDLAIAPASLTFTQATWNTPQAVMITVALELMMFGELTIVHEVSSSDPNYQDFPVPPVTLELTDVNADLQTLELRRVAGGAPVSLEQVGVADPAEGFDPNVPEYRAEVPFGAGQVFLTATPAVTEEVDG